MRQQGLPHIVGIAGSKPSGQKKQTFSNSFYPLQLVSGASANRLFDCVVPLPGRFVSIQRTRAGLAPEKIDEGWTWEIEIEEVQVFARV